MKYVPSTSMKMTRKYLKVDPIRSKSLLYIVLVDKNFKVRLRKTPTDVFLLAEKHHMAL